MKIIFLSFLMSFSLLNATQKMPDPVSLNDISIERQIAIRTSLERFRTNFYEYWDSLVLLAQGKLIFKSLKEEELWGRIYRNFPITFPLPPDVRLVILAVVEGTIPLANRFTMRFTDISEDRKATITKQIDFFKAEYAEYWDDLVAYVNDKFLFNQTDDFVDFYYMQGQFPFAFPLCEDVRLIIKAEDNKRENRFVSRIISVLAKRSSIPESFSSSETRPSRLSCLLCSRGGISDDDTEPS